MNLFVSYEVLRPIASHQISHERSHCDSQMWVGQNSEL